ncbi:UNVERIFIED_CONTAM: hypothetical protein HDU68_010839 [Siphonaria sp. JEL0065]|nr:hypothetical protein HDU68_010839 [Siphonaria sp. JEL0065]
MSNWLAVHKSITGATGIHDDIPSFDEGSSEGIPSDIASDDGNEDWEDESEEGEDNLENEDEDQMEWDLEDEESIDEEWNEGHDEHRGMHYLSDDEEEEDEEDVGKHEGQVTSNVKNPTPIEVEETGVAILKKLDAATLLLEEFQDIMYDASPETLQHLSALTHEDYSWFGGLNRPDLVENSGGIIAEIMAKCNIAAAVSKDWWPDWAVSTRLVVAKPGVEASESSGLDELDPNDSVIPILQHSEPLSFVITSDGHPYQWAHSASDAYHQQCARYLVLGEQEPVSFFHLSQTESPPEHVRQFPSLENEPSLATKPWTVHLQRPITCVSRFLLRAGVNPVSDSRNASQRNEWGQLGIGLAPDVFPFTKYLARSEDDMVMPRDEKLMSLPAEVVSMDMAFGFLAIGFDDGILAGFCVENGIPRLILYETASNRNDMFNSVHISRRIVRKADFDEMADENQFEHEHTLLVTRNTGAVDVHVLSKHSTTSSGEPADNKPTVVCPNHVLATKCSETLEGFVSPPNDARFSPDGKYLACVGDDGGVWIADVTYSSTAEAEEEEFDSTLRVRRFGKFKKLDLGYLFVPMAAPPVSVSGTVSNRRPFQTTSSQMTMQYMSWSCGSRFFAASCDSFPWVLVFDAENDGKIVCRLDAGTPTYAVTFHPTNPYILAFSNRMSYVHIVDLTEHLAKPIEEISTTTEQPPFIYPPRQILRHDYQVPVEPRTGSYPDLTALGRSAGALTTNISSGGSHQGFLQESFSGLAAKINGILWSDDGQRLFVATNRRVLMHTVVEREAASLLECVSRKVWNDELGDLAEKDEEGAEVLKDWAQDLLTSKKWAGHWRY